MSLVEDTDESIEKADTDEQRVIEEVRKIGLVALSKWAESKNKRNETELKNQPELRSAGKNCGGIAALILSKLKKPYFVRKHMLLVLFQIKRIVSRRSTSTPLQRAITDFGADRPFGQVNTKLQEHYGIEVPVSTIRLITERHGKAIFEQTNLVSDWSDIPDANDVIAETDGGRVSLRSQLTLKRRINAKENTGLARIETVYCP